MTKKRTKTLPGLVEDGFILEEVLPPSGVPEFIGYENGSTHSAVSSLPMDNGLEIVPLNDELLEKGAVLLPSEPEEYEDEGTLFMGLVAWAQRYADVEESLLKLSVLNVMMGWLSPKPPTWPILNIRGPSETGKTRFGEVLWQTSYRGMRGDGALSHSSLFRTSEKWGGTLFLNEGDLPRRQDPETSAIGKFLNARYENSAFVWRTNRETMKQEVFQCSGPTILITRGDLRDDALESRSIVVPMRPTRRKDIPLNLPPSFYTEAQGWRNKLLTFRFRRFSAFENDYSFRFKGQLQLRIQQILQPMASLARDLSPGLFRLVKDLANELNERVIEDRADSKDGLIVRVYLELARGNPFVAASMIAEALENDFGAKTSPSAVGKLAKGLGFVSMKTPDGKARYLSIGNEALLELGEKYVPKDLRESLLSGFRGESDRTDTTDRNLGTQAPPNPEVYEDRLRAVEP